MTTNLFRYAAIYYFVCGLSGLFWPTSWYIVAGLSPELPGLLIRIVGAVLLALGIGFYRAHRHPAERPVVTRIGIWANFLDLVAVVIGMIQLELPFGSGVGFVVVDIFWLVLLWRAHRGFVRASAQK